MTMELVHWPECTNAPCTCLERGSIIMQGNIERLSLCLCACLDCAWLGIAAELSAQACPKCDGRVCDQGSPEFTARLKARITTCLLCDAPVLGKVFHTPRTLPHAPYCSAECVTAAEAKVAAGSPEFTERLKARVPNAR